MWLQTFIQSQIQRILECWQTARFLIRSRTFRELPEIEILLADLCLIDSGKWSAVQSPYLKIVRDVPSQKRHWTENARQVLSAMFPDVERSQIGVQTECNQERYGLS